jgi:hypothetical protein
MQKSSIAYKADIDYWFILLLK